MSRIENKIETDKAPTPVGAYPHARRAGPFLFLSGVGPRQACSGEIGGNSYDENGELVNYDISLQCHAVFKNICVILEAAGAGWDDLIDVTVFLTDMKNDFAIFNRIYAEYFTTSQPCRTTVEVNALPTDIAIELKCVAYSDKER